jgi:hypothetical protein
VYTEVILINDAFLNKNIYAWSLMKKEAAVMRSEPFKALVAAGKKDPSPPPERIVPEYTLINHAKIDFIVYVLQTLHGWTPREAGRILSQRNGTSGIGSSGASTVATAKTSGERGRILRGAGAKAMDKNVLTSSARASPTASTNNTYPSLPTTVSGSSSNNNSNDKGNDNSTTNSTSSVGGPFDRYTWVDFGYLETDCFVPRRAFRSSALDPNTITYMVRQQLETRDGDPVYVLQTHMQKVMGGFFSGRKTQLLAYQAAYHEALNELHKRHIVDDDQAVVPFVYFNSQGFRNSFKNFTFVKVGHFEQGLKYVCDGVRDGCGTSIKL